MARRREVLKEVILPINRESVIGLSERMDEPKWLREKRLEAWELAESMPVPTTKDEPWRRTDLRRVDWTQGHTLVNPNGSTTIGQVPTELYRPLIGDEQGGLLVFVDGKLVYIECSDELDSKGVVFTDLSTAWRDHRDLLEQYFMTQAVRPDEGKFAALHAALWTHGVFLYVPAGVDVDQPLHSVEYTTGGDLTSTHILVVVDDEASATYLHESVSPYRSEQSTHLGVTELLVGEGGNLRYVGLQNWNESTVSIGHQRGRVEKGGELDWVSGEMGTRFSKLFQTLDLDGDDSFGRISGLYFTHGRQHLDLDTQQNHHALRTTSDLLYKGVLKEKSHTVWQGMILVDPGAQRTDGFQANRNLMLDSTARSDSIPGLEIEADDVRCTHAATAGRIDDTELFYLLSRGIPRDVAEKLIVDGFFDPVMQRIPFEGVRERLAMSIDEKLGQAGG